MKAKHNASAVAAITVVAKNLGKYPTGSVGFATCLDDLEAIVSVLRAKHQVALTIDRLIRTAEVSVLAARK